MKSSSYRLAERHGAVWTERILVSVGQGKMRGRDDEGSDDVEMEFHGRWDYECGTRKDEREG